MMKDLPINYTSVDFQHEYPTAERRNVIPTIRREIRQVLRDNLDGLRYKEIEQRVSVTGDDLTAALMNLERHGEVLQKKDERKYQITAAGLAAIMLDVPHSPRS